jgi:phage tail-like protein
MPTGQRQDPYVAFQFIVEIDGIARAGFREASGLETRQDPIEYREGMDGQTVRKLPGLVTYSPITLRWGITDDAGFWQWRQSAVAGTVDRRNGSIVLLDQTGTEKLRWNFREGWPSSWSGPTFDATTNDIAVESVEISHEGIGRAT